MRRVSKQPEISSIIKNENIHSFVGQMVRDNEYNLLQVTLQGIIDEDMVLAGEEYNGSIT